MHDADHTGDRSHFEISDEAHQNYLFVRGRLRRYAAITSNTSHGKELAMRATFTTRVLDLAVATGLLAIAVLQVGYIWPIATYRFLLH